MQRFLPSLWLLAAALYAAATLLLDHALFAAAPPARVAVHETVVAKQPARAPELKAPEQHAIQPSAEAGTQHRNIWVQVANYTTVVHAQPSASSPVTFAYPTGEQLRVIARQAGFARVQDLASGHLGWIAEASLVPRMRGYRLREPAPVQPKPQFVAQAPVQVAVAELSPSPRAEPAARPIKVVAAPAAVQPSRHAPRPPVAEPAVIRVAETTGTQTWAGGLFRHRDQARLMPANARGGPLAGLVQRAFGRF